MSAVTKISEGIYAAGNSVGVFKNTEKPTVVKDESNENDIVSWGDSNKYPQEFLEALRKNGAANGALKILKATHFGEGLTLYKDDFQEGKKNHTLVDIKDFPEINSFFKQNKINRFFFETITDLELWDFALPEFIVSNDYKKIVRIKRQRSAWARFKPMGKDGLISTAYLKPDWEDDSIEKDTPKLNLVDPYWSVEEIRDYLKEKNLKKFVIPTYMPMIDEVYYPKVGWHSSYHNGWFEVSNSVAELKKYIFNNQIHLKYIIHISEKYFEKYYKDEWDEYSIEKKESIRKKLVETINDHLMGNKAGGRSITAPKFLDDNGNYVKGIEVDVIDNKMKDGAHLPDAAAANSEILFAMGVDPTLIGAGIPGGKLGAGSGSDKREAFTILSGLFKSRRMVSLEIWDFIRDYNGWESDLKASFPNIVLTTLDKNPTGNETKM